jgi:hypothetical protein
MRARTNTGVLWSWIASLSIGVACAAPAAHAQTYDGEPTGTISEEPEVDPAAAQDADRKARSLFQQGKQAYEDGNYRDAWDYFRQAYLLSKRPELLYNVGQSADRLRMDREALAAFRLYLKKLPNADNRREVENRVRALEERLGENAGGAPSEENDGGAARATGTETQASSEDDLTFFNSTPPPPPAGSNGQPTRTGWYVRLSLGLGLLHDIVSNLASNVSLSSATAVGQVAVGYDVAQGIVLGGMLSFDWSLSPSLKVEGGASFDVHTANITMLAAFIDYYLEPRQDGWHLLGALGFGSFALSETSATIGTQDASGIGLIAGGGYEWPIDRQWAIGWIGRLLLARLNQDTAHHNVIAPSVAFTAAWY